MQPTNFKEHVRMNDQIPLVLSWQKIAGFTTPTLITPKPKKLLNNVYGIARTGSLTAVISPSGGGKTTLLAILSGRYKGIVEGQIQLNGYDVNKEIISCIAGFVCQKNQLFENLTVEEHLKFMARLKMEKGSSSSCREKNVLRVVDNLLLSHRMNVKLESLSGGQKKRLALAIQLLTEPRILFCDEPTTGLDSYSAIIVVKLLRRLADQGKMIICAIHQPASGIFEMFDDVSVLASNGSLAYHGSVEKVYSYFDKIGFQCPENYNLCEFVVSNVTVRPSVFKETENDHIRVENLVAEFHKSVMYKELIENIENITHDKTTEVYSIVEYYCKIDRHRVGIHIQFAWLLWRSTLLLKRSYKTWAIRFLLYLFVYCCISFPYGHIIIDQTGVQNMQGLLNCVQIELLYASMYGVIYVIPDQLATFVQESADHTYSAFPYYVSHLIILSSKAVFEAFIFANLAFGVTGLNTSFTDYFYTVQPVILLAITASAYGFFLSTAFESITTASLFSVPFELVSNVFAGLYIRLRSLPSYIVWMKYLSLSYYAYEALSVNQWNKHPHIACFKEDLSECYLNGDQVLQSYGFSRSHIYWDYVGLIVYAIVLHILGFAFLLRKLKIMAAY